VKVGKKAPTTSIYYANDNIIALSGTPTKQQQQQQSASTELQATVDDTQTEWKSLPSAQRQEAFVFAAAVATNQLTTFIFPEKE